MAQKDRTGNRKTCEQRKPFKITELPPHCVADIISLWLSYRYFPNNTMT